MQTNTTQPPNPTSNSFNSDSDRPADEELLTLALAGNRDQLELLITRHLPWIFNLSLRMLHRRADAEGATQETLLKTLKALPSFRGEARFRTWLYRIAANHLLTIRKPKSSASDPICSFPVASARLRQVPGLDPPDPRTIPVPPETLALETGRNCMIGTLLCLDGRQRLAYILGEIFQVSDLVGAEICEVSPDNFRQILSRARRDLYEYLHDNCSLVHPCQACKCARKTRAFIQAGFVDPNHLEFTQAHTNQIKDVAPKRAAELLDAYEEVASNVYRDHPFYELSRQTEMLRRVLPSLHL